MAGYLAGDVDEWICTLYELVEKEGEKRVGRAA